MNYKQLDRKASQLITKVQNKIDKSGAYENAGQKELIQFKDILSESQLTYSEKWQLEQMFNNRIDNLNYNGGFNHE